MVDINTIKNWFKTGLKPTQEQFWAVWDSFRHKSDKIPVQEIQGLDELLFLKADKAGQENTLEIDIYDLPNNYTNQDICNYINNLPPSERTIVSDDSLWYIVIAYGVNNNEA